MAPQATKNPRSELPTYNSRSSISSAGGFTMTPPLSPPQYAGPSARTIRAPTAAHFSPFTMSPPYTQPFPTPARNSQMPNPYSEVSSVGNQSFTHRSSEWPTQNVSFDVSSNVASPTSPSFPPMQYPIHGAPGEESLFDRWLRHEDLARPMFPGSKTGSSVATSDISSVREGMFGALPSLPGGSIMGEGKRSENGGAGGPGSIFSAGTRDRDNFSTSTPSYPSSRAGGSRPSSRWGGEGNFRSVDEETYSSSTPSSPGINYVDLNSRLRHPAPPPAPTPPTSSTMSSIPSSTSSVVDGEDVNGRRIPRSPEPAATRPPRYSETITNPIDLAELINRGMAGYQGAMPLQYPSEKNSEKEQLGGTGTVMLVQEDVWLEMKRLAALGQQQQQTGTGNNNSWDNVDLEKGLSNKNPGGDRERRNRKKGKEAGCCGACVIC